MLGCLVINYWISICFRYRFVIGDIGVSRIEVVFMFKDLIV